MLPQVNTPANAWRLIDSAPKNGPDFLAVNDKGDMRRCWRQAPSRNVDRIVTFDQRPFAATHWTPILHATATTVSEGKPD